MKGFNRLVRLLAKDESGAVLILVAVLIVVLMGTAALAVDGGSLYQTRRQMVNAADSAALAGAQELILSEGNKSQAEAVARDYAVRLNGSDIDKVTVDFPNDYTIVVEVGKQVDFGFARIFGMDNSDVPARAAAVIGATSEVEGIIPIALPNKKFLDFVGEAEGVDIINFNFDFGAGNRNWITFTGTGPDFNPNQTAEYIRYGYPYHLEVDDPVQTDTGAAMIPPMQDAINYHIVNETELYMPIVDDEEIAQGTFSYKIVGFAAIKLTSLYREQGVWYLTAILLTNHIYPSAPSTSAPNYELHSITLISENDID